MKKLNRYAPIALALFAICGVIIGVNAGSLGPPNYGGGSGNGITSLTGDVTATGPGAAVATVVKSPALSVSGQTGLVTIAGPTSTNRILTVDDAAQTLARRDAGQTFIGVQVMTSPSFTTPSLGAATATSINGNTITTGTGTLTLGAGKTTTFDHTSTFTTTDAQTYTFPTTTATLARTDAANTFTGNQTIIGDTINATIQHLTETTTTAAGYTLLLTDDYKVVTVNTAGANTLTIPTHASVAFPVGTQITVIQKGAGAWTVAGAGGVTIVSNGAAPTLPILRVQYSAATLWQDASDHWYVFGDIK